jgi:dTDP-4-amino-4,6-dideoxygalactose transaminase
MATMPEIREVPFFNYPYVFREHESAYLRIIQDVLSRGAFIMQRDLESFETNLARYLGVKHVVGVADGTMALTMALVAAGLREGDEVIVPSHTFVASAAAIRHAGGMPVLADCGRDHLIDPTSIERVLTPRTKAIMPVQLNGRTADMDAIGAIAERHHLMIIEDACQALGSRFRGRCAGTFGRAAGFSFYPAKTLGCFGDGGAVATDDEATAQTVRQLRDHGREPDGSVVRWGFNARLDNLQAAVLDFRLTHYGATIARRRALARLYHERLKDVPALLLPPGPDEDPDHFDIYQNYEIEAEERDSLQTYLATRGIQALRQWKGFAVHQFGPLQLRGEFAYTERMTGRFLLLPLNTSLSDEDVRYVCDCIEEFYLRAGGQRLGSGQEPRSARAS